MALTLIEALGDLLPKSMLGLWKRRGIETLLPLQSRVVEETGLLEGRNLLVLAPSSSGKSLIGELAIARALACGRRGIFLVPTRAVAEQIAAAFESGFQGTGLRVLCSTSERPENDGEVVAARFDVLVAVYEKVRAFLATDTRLLAGVGAVVVDEIQSLDDPQRGPSLDLLVTQILRSPYSPQMVALGPRMPNVDALASWLRAEIVESTERARPLHEGVLMTSSGAFHYRDAGQKAVAFEKARRETWVPPGVLEKLERSVEEAAERLAIGLGEGTVSLLAGAAWLALTFHPAILFAPTRRCARRWAGLLAEMEAEFPPARVALGALEQSGAAGRIRERLRHALAGGVGFHCADLPPELRTMVETAFESGEISLLVSTPTLALGVNLSAQTVIHTPWRRGSSLEISRSDEGESGGMASASVPDSSIVLPLGRARFAQQGGRAGRFGRGNAPGRSVLIAGTPEEARRLWDGLVAAPDASMERPPLRHRATTEIALALLAGGVRRSAVNLAGEWGETLSARLDGEANGGSRAGNQDIRFRDAMEELAGQGLVREGEDRLWGLTGMGEAAVRSEIPPSMMESLQLAIEPWDEEPDPSLRDHQCLFRLARTPNGEQALAPLPFSRCRLPLPLPEGLDLADGRSIQAPALRRGGFSARDFRAWWAASALTDWSRGLETEFLEEKYHVYAGAVASAGEAIARFVFSASGLARAMGWGPEIVGSLGEFGERLSHGVGGAGLALARLRLRGLSRDAIGRLQSEGWSDPIRIGLDPAPDLVPILGEEMAGRLKDACRVRPREAASGPVTLQRAAACRRNDSGKSRASAAPDPASPVPLLEISLQSPGIVRAKGREVRLPPLGFDLLVALAERRGEVVTRSALYHRLWPEGGPEDQQLDAHRRRLIGRLRAALGPEAERVAEVVRGMGFRLAVHESRIRLWRGESKSANRVASSAPHRDKFAE